MAATVSLAQTQPPSANMPVGAEAWGISKKLPVADFRIGVEGPKPDRLWEDRWHLILLQPEDHRRAVPRCGGDWGSVPSYGLSRHGRFKPARGPSGELSWEQPQRESDAIFIPDVDPNLLGMALRKLITPDLSGAPGGLMLGSIAAIKLKTAVVRGDIPVFQHVEEETRHGFLPAGAFKSVGRPIVRWSKTACLKFRLLSWERLLVAPLRPKSEGGNPRVTRRSPSSANFTAGPNADHCWYKKDREPRCTVCLEYSIERSC